MWILVEIEEYRAGQRSRARGQQPLELLFHDRTERRAFIDVHVVQAAMRIAIEKHRRLVDAVDDAVSRNLVKTPGNPSEGVEQFSDMYDIADSLARLNNARLVGEGRHADTALGHIVFAAAEDAVLSGFWEDRFHHTGNLFIRHWTCKKAVSPLSHQALLLRSGF